MQKAHGLPVNLKQPDTEIFVEVDQREVFVFTGGQPGQGGLPVGMSGRAVALMSGGIDSPVAAYRMMRRGLRCHFLHFSGMPLTGPESIYKAYALVRGLDRFQGGSRLFVVPFGKTQQALASSGADRLQVMAQRRLMLKTAAALAKRLDAAALVTGDSLGQVSSQTLPNITALDNAVRLPILRPLLGWDKTEIMAEARQARHAVHLRAAGSGLLHAAHPAPGGDPGADRRPAPHRGTAGRRGDRRTARRHGPGVPPGVTPWLAAARVVANPPPARAPRPRRARGGAGGRSGRERAADQR